MATQKVATWKEYLAIFQTINITVCVTAMTLVIAIVGLRSSQTTPIIFADFEKRTVRNANTNINHQTANIPTAYRINVICQNIEIALIHNKYHHHKTSYGIVYDMNEFSCTFNSASLVYEKINPQPCDLIFISIKVNGKVERAYLKVIGTFHDPNNPQRAIAISNKSAMNLKFPLNKGIVRGTIGIVGNDNYQQ